MATHVPPLSKRRGNIIFSEDGSVWCNYLLTGINVNSYRPETAVAAQDAHKLLFDALSYIPTDDVALHLVKARVDPMSTFARMTKGVPQWNPELYRYLGQLLNDFNDRMVRGEFSEYERVYWLAISKPSKQTMQERIAASLIESDPHEKLNWTDLGDFEKKCFQAIPSEFHPVRTAPELVDWFFERVTTRGISTPMLPTPNPNIGVVPGEKSYPQVHFDVAAEATSLYQTFVKDLRDGRGYVKELTKSSHASKLTATVCLLSGIAGVAATVTGHMFLASMIFGAGLSAAAAALVRSAFSGPHDHRVGLFRRFRTLRDGKIMAISHPERRSAAFPDGPVSYQSLVGIARYPSKYVHEVSDFTYIIDKAIGMDADCTLRMRFGQELLDISAISKADRSLVSEGTANAEDEFEARDYDKRRGELRRFHDAVDAESGPRGMQVAVIFAFGSDNIDVLNSRLAAQLQKFRSKGYVPLLPVGGQKELWTMMMPGSRRTSLGDDLMQTTTVHWFSGAMPCRRSFAGDEFGMPIAVNKENALGQIILLDLLNATNRGNASIAITGAQGSGKSNLMKLIYLYVTALNRYAVAIDHSKHGEWAVFSRQLARTQVVQAAYGDRSMDPLKCLGSPEAEVVFMAHYLPLMGLDTQSEEAAYLAHVLRPEFRGPRGITSTRRLLEWLKTRGDAEAKPILRSLEHWAALPYTGTFIDPPPRGDGDYGLPPFDNIAELSARMETGQTPYATVFRTHDLPVYRGVNNGNASDLNKWAAAVYGTIARMTASRFGKIRGTCVAFLDETSFLKGNEDVVELLVRSPDRTGRKDGNFIVAGSQHADDFDHNYAMIEKKAALRQKTTYNARTAIEYAGMPVLDSLVDMMMSQTSPPDPDNNNMTRAGRYGEGWWNDGNNNIARVQFLPILSPELARFADTTSSKMIRETDLDADGRLRQQPGRHALDGGRR